MIIDYLLNPLGIVKKFFIPYGDNKDQLYLEARIMAITEEGFDSAEWFEIEVGYPSKGKRRFSELSKNILNYGKLTERSVPSLEEAIGNLRNWCNQEEFKLLDMAPTCVN